GSRVADIACGPGTLAFIAARSGFSVDAIDFSTEMIHRLDRRARSEGVRGVTARVGDGQALPYQDETYAAAFSLFGLMFFPDRARGFAELRRVLRPGARAVVSSWQPMERVPVLAAVFAALMEALPKSPDGAVPAPLGTDEECRAEMGRSFRDVAVHPMSLSTKYPSALALWESMERSMPPLVLMRRQLGEERWAPLSRVGAA